eukprot:3998431-Prorocentrum_lima.AAC.1
MFEQSLEVSQYAFSLHVSPPGQSGAKRTAAVRRFFFTRGNAAESTHLSCLLAEYLWFPWRRKACGRMRDQRP